MCFFWKKTLVCWKWHIFYNCSVMCELVGVWLVGVWYLHDWELDDSFNMVKIQKQAVPRRIFVINIKKFSMTLNVYNITRKFVIFADFGHIANDWLPFKKSVFFFLAIWQICCFSKGISTLRCSYIGTNHPSLMFNVLEMYFFFHHIHFI